MEPSKRRAWEVLVLMERKHFHPAAFILILAVILSFLSSFMTPSFLRKNGMTLSGSVCSVSLAHEKRNSIDVLVVGDSESYTSVSPMALWKQYGITSFDVGKAGAKISETKEMLEDALGTQNPQVVLLETNNLFRYKAKTEDEHASVLADVCYEAFPFLRYHNIWKQLFTNELTGAFKGFKLNSVVRPYTGKTYGKVVTGNQITPETYVYLEQIKSLCEKKGARLILYSAPSPKCYTKEKTNLLKKVAKKYGLTYLNLNSKTDQIGINWNTDTRDHGDHLNTSGALKTTAYLGQYLTAKCSVTGRSGRAETALWNKTYKKYKAAETKALQEIQWRAGEMGGVA